MRDDEQQKGDPSENTGAFGFQLGFEFRYIPQNGADRKVPKYAIILHSSISTSSLESFSNA